MNISIDNQSAAWYQQEMDLEKGDSVRFYPRYGGYSPIQAGFSLGINLEDATNPVVTEEKEGITYFINEEDLWYFDGHNLKIVFDDKKGEPEFLYSK